MGPSSPDLLTRVPLIATADLNVAQQTTSQFWPAHSSEVLGPDDYDLVMNRALLGQIAITYVRCTARVRVVPTEPCHEACLVVPLEGSVEIETAAGTFRATPAHPLFRAPVWVTRFEASPSACLLVDVPAVAIEAALASHGDRRSLATGPLATSLAKPIRRELLSLVRMINRNDRVVALQRVPEAQRGHLLSSAVRRREWMLLASVAAALASDGAESSSRVSLTEIASLQEWLREQALRNRSLAEIAQLAGTNMRALQRACARAGFTPQAFIHAVRLDRARDLLCDPTSATTVADVATAVCLPHLGRFSAYYRERFGEQPSDTLAKARLRAALDA